MDPQLERDAGPLTRPRIGKILAFARAHAAADPAHDLSHCLRVLRNALRIAEHEGGDPELLAAAIEDFL